MLEGSGSRSSSTGARLVATLCFKEEAGGLVLEWLLLGLSILGSAKRARLLWCLKERALGDTFWDNNGNDRWFIMKESF